MSHGNANHTEEEGLSTAMRLLIHYVGDIHQPLHATTKFDATYPSGDRGGNSFKVLEKDGIKELHGVWDSILYEHSGYDTLVSKYLIKYQIIGAYSIAFYIEITFNLLNYSSFITNLIISKHYLKTKIRLKLYIQKLEKLLNATKRLI